MLKVTTYPASILRRTAKPVSQFNDELKKLVEQMAEAMWAYDGIGLAAVQVNQNQHLALIAQGKKDYKVVINPEITYYSRDKKTEEEGCLSLPGIFGLVPRAKKIRVKYQDLSGKVIKEKIKGFEAVVMQHEVDHLNGVLFIDRTDKITKGQDELEKLKSKVNESK